MYKTSELRGLQFEWDDEKYAFNVWKHNIKFEEAAEDFFGQLSVYGVHYGQHDYAARATKQLTDFKEMHIFSVFSVGYLLDGKIIRRRARHGQQ